MSDLDIYPFILYIFLVFSYNSSLTYPRIRITWYKSHVLRTNPPICTIIIIIILHKLVGRPPYISIMSARHIHIIYIFNKRICVDLLCFPPHDHSQQYDHHLLPLVMHEHLYTHFKRHIYWTYTFCFLQTYFVFFPVNSLFIILLHPLFLHVDTFYIICLCTHMSIFHIRSLFMHYHEFYHMKAKLNKRM